MERLRSDSVLKVYDNGGHAFHVMVWREIAAAAWRDQFAFLAERVGLSVEDD
jgi:hypothetical protein